MSVVAIKLRLRESPLDSNREWREACCRFLTACFAGASSQELKRLATAQWDARARRGVGWWLQ